MTPNLEQKIIATMPVDANGVSLFLNTGNQYKDRNKGLAKVTPAWIAIMVKHINI